MYPEKFRKVVEALGDSPTREHLENLKRTEAIKDFRMYDIDGVMYIDVKPGFPEDGLRKVGDGDWHYWNPWE